LSVAVVPREWAQAAAGADVVIGARAAAWAPCPELAAMVVLDGHDEGLQQEQAPTWNAWIVAAERAQRAGVPCVITSPCPSVELLAWASLVAPSRTVERAGWAPLEVIDRRRDDPHTGLYSARLVGLLRGSGRVICVLNRKGRARLLACSSCGELARCEKCGAAVGQAAGGALVCARCGTSRPVVCLSCGSTRLKALRLGVSRVREELEALAGRVVGEVTAETRELPVAPVLVGTEAVLHRVDSVDGVAFLDFDQELLAPRYRAAEESMILLARASRLVGGRRRGGRVLVQTRVPNHEVLTAAVGADPSRLAVSEAGMRTALGLPPDRALAVVSGAAAPTYVSALRDASFAGVEISGPDNGRWLLRAADHAALCNLLASVARTPGRLRVEVDPLRA
jgi:primosomal protein N' (replication factor Y)